MGNTVEENGFATVSSVTRCHGGNELHHLCIDCDAVTLVVPPNPGDRRGGVPAVHLQEDCAADDHDAFVRLRSRESISWRNRFATFPDASSVCRPIRNWTVYDGIDKQVFE